MENIDLIIIDLFCGAGGVTTGFSKTNGCKVIACINHDAVAIASHKANHPEAVHFVEDIRKVKMSQLMSVVKDARKLYPNAKLLIHASLECTNFSKAKGGKARDGDSRSLADDMPRYSEALKPDYFTIENVMEFMSWGPLDENGKPISKLNGTDYVKWVHEMKSVGEGYDYEWRQLNAADFGGYTTRKRFFACYAKSGLPIAFPEPTHTKDPSNSSLFPLEKWKPVKEVLELDEKGASIFDRKIPLVDATLERIFAGLVKFVAGGKKAYLLKYNSINGKTGKYVPPGIDEPCPTVSCQGRLAIVQTDFLAKYYSGRPEGKVNSIDEPAGTVRTSDTLALVQPNFLAAYYGSGDNVHSANGPSPVVRTKDCIALVQPEFIMRDFSNGDNVSSIESPAGTVTNVPKMNLVSSIPFIMDTAFNNTVSSVDEPSKTITANRKWHYLVNPQWFNNSASSVDEPCFTLIARMDKAPPYIVSTKEGFVAIAIYETDSEVMIIIKTFMAMYGIADICMRMLFISELKAIQGFPKSYVLCGTQTQQKKFIGNSVETNVMHAWATAIVGSLQKLKAA